MKTPPRIVSVDALRGFDMFWIIGGEEVAKALEPTGGGAFTSAVVARFKPVEWAGYLLVEVWRWQKWCGPFVWIGTNALTVYLAVNLVEFNAIAARFVGGDLKRMMDAQLAKGAGELLVAIVGLFLPVLLARFLYQRNVFIRL